jgi:hypothetical protein
MFSNHHDRHTVDRIRNDHNNLGILCEGSDCHDFRSIARENNFFFDYTMGLSIQSSDQYQRREYPCAWTFCFSIHHQAYQDHQDKISQILHGQLPENNFERLLPDPHYSLCWCSREKL